MGEESPTAGGAIPMHQEAKKRENFQRKSSRKPLEYEDDPTEKQVRKDRKIKGSLLASHKPSYCLRRSIGRFGCSGEKLRSHHRTRLRWLVKRLIRNHSWKEAGGVLSVLLQGTGKEQSPARNRFKYGAALEILNYMKDGNISTRKIQNVYDLWMKKIGPLKNWSEKSRFAVQVEFIISCLQQGNRESAHQAALCLMQEKGFESEPVSCLAVGLVYYELWYSDIPIDLKLTELDSFNNCMKSEIPVGGNGSSTNISVQNDAIDAGGSKSPLRSTSNSSIANDKTVFEDDSSLNKEVSRMKNDSMGKEISCHALQKRRFYKNSSGKGRKMVMDYSFSNDSDHLPHTSIFTTQCLQPWMLPLKLPNSHENLEDAMEMHKKLRNDFYRSAVKHLRNALHSTPPVIEAFHPLIQILLLGDEVNEALGELQNLHHSSSTIVQLRLKAGLLYHFDAENCVKLCTSFEDILKKDPTCSDSLAKLLLLHQHGDYDAQNLVEMIALHLDAVHGTSDTWKELSSCLLKLSKCDEDRTSTCGDGSKEEIMSSFTKIPEIFTKSESGKAWRFRFRWWLNRHFHNSILKSDITSGDAWLLTCKAAAAGQIYGQHFKYVVKAMEYVRKENDMEMYSFLKTHVRNSIGFYQVSQDNVQALSIK